MAVLRQLKNINMSSGSPTGVVSLLPGGAGVQTAGSQANPMVGTPSLDFFLGGCVDNTPLYLAAAGTVQGQLLALPYALPNGLTAANQAGGGFWQQTGGYSVPYGRDSYGVSFISNSATGSETFVVTSGPCQALCTASTTAIAYGSLLCSDGLGNLTTFQPPSTPATPSVATVGTSGSTDYKYAIVAISKDGTYSALSTAGDIASGNATLTTTNYNQITITPRADAVGYIIVRTSSAGTPTSVGVIGQVLADQTTFNDTGLAIVPNTSATQFFQLPAAASTPTVTNGGASGSTTWTYKVSAIMPNGVWSVAESSGGSNTTGVATLTTANYNNITFTLTSGAVAYAIDRTAAGTSPTALGIIGYVAVTPGTTPTIAFHDTGLPVIATYANSVVTTPNPTPQAGCVLGVSLGTLSASTTTATLTNVWVGGW